MHIVVAEASCWGQHMASWLKASSPAMWHEVTAGSAITEGAPRAVRWLLLELNSCKQGSKFLLAIAPSTCAVSGYSGKTFSRTWGLWPCSLRMLAGQVVHLLQQLPLHFLLKYCQDPSGCSFTGPDKYTVLVFWSRNGCTSVVYLFMLTKPAKDLYLYFISLKMRQSNPLATCWSCRNC